VVTSPTPEPSPIRGGEGSPCTCGHLDVFHNIGTRRGAPVRTACSTSSGPQATPCPCRQFTPTEEP